MPKIKITARFEEDQSYLLTVTAPWTVDVAMTTAPDRETIREYGLRAAREQLALEGEAEIEAVRFARPAVGSDGEQVRLRPSGRIGVAGWWGAEGAWLVSGPGFTGFSVPEDVDFEFTPSPEERVRMEAWREKQRLDAAERWKRMGRNALKVLHDQLVAQIAGAASQHPGARLRMGVAPYIADALTPDELHKLTRGSVEVEVYARPETAAHDIAIDAV